MQGPDLDAALDPLSRPEPVEHTVVEHVPEHRHGRQHHGQGADFEHRAIEQPGAERGTDQHGNGLEAYGVDDTLDEGFVGNTHDITWND
ncbi:hypothetical protein D3C76_746150 [compost metagenome]